MTRLNRVILLPTLHNQQSYKIGISNFIRRENLTPLSRFREVQRISRGYNCVICVESCEESVQGLVLGDFPRRAVVNGGDFGAGGGVA